MAAFLVSSSWGQAKIKTNILSVEVAKLHGAAEPNLAKDRNTFYHLEEIGYQPKHLMMYTDCNWWPRKFVLSRRLKLGPDQIHYSHSFNDLTSIIENIEFVCSELLGR